MCLLDFFFSDFLIKNLSKEQSCECLAGESWLQSPAQSASMTVWLCHRVGGWSARPPPHASSSPASLVRWEGVISGEPETHPASTTQFPG